MSYRSGAIFWALVLIVLGVIFLLRNAGVLNVSWNVIWPVLLIVLGGSLLLGNFIRPSSSETRSLSIPIDGAREARVVVHQGAGRLRINSSADPMTLAANAFDGELIQSVRREGDRLDVRLRQEHGWMFWWPWNWGGGWHWEMSLNRDVPLSLEVKPGASQADIDLRDLKVRDFRLDTGASTVDLTVPASGQVTGRIKAGAATVRVRVPEGVALRIRSHLGAASLNVRGNRFQWGDSTYQTPDFDTAANRADLEIDAGAASIDVF
ncbi:MAG TPA: DUF5668 domain-containing protein [Anaerolineae bacterium]